MRILGSLQREGQQRMWRERDLFPPDRRETAGTGGGAKMEIALARVEMNNAHVQYAYVG